MDDFLRLHSHSADVFLNLLNLKANNSKEDKSHSSLKTRLEALGFCCCDKQSRNKSRVRVAWRATSFVLFFCYSTCSSDMCKATTSSIDSTSTMNSTTTWKSMSRRIRSCCACAESMAETFHAWMRPEEKHSRELALGGKSRHFANIFKPFKRSWNPFFVIILFFICLLF